MSVTPGLNLPFGIQPTNPIPVETYRGPYGDIYEAMDFIPPAVVHDGMTVKITGQGEYWWLADPVLGFQLVPKGAIPMDETGSLLNDVMIEGPHGLYFGLNHPLDSVYFNAYSADFETDSFNVNIGIQSPSIGEGAYFQIGQGHVSMSITQVNDFSDPDNPLYQASSLAMYGFLQVNIESWECNIYSGLVVGVMADKPVFATDGINALTMVTQHLIDIDSQRIDQTCNIFNLKAATSLTIDFTNPYTSASADVQIWAYDDFKGVQCSGNPLNFQPGALITKHYVDDAIEQMYGRMNLVVVATTENILLIGQQNIDTIDLNIDDRVLVKDQADPSENGIYLVRTDEWVRASDVNNVFPAGFSQGIIITPGKGTQKNTGWLLTDHYNIDSQDPIQYTKVF